MCLLTHLNRHYIHCGDGSISSRPPPRREPTVTLFTLKISVGNDSKNYFEIKIPGEKKQVFGICSPDMTYN